MTYGINAWLDCADPQLKVFDKESGAEMMSFDSEEVEEMMNHGEFCLNDLYSSNHQVLEEVIRTLALFRCLRDSTYTC